LYTLPSYLWTPQRRGIEETIALLEAGKDVCLYGPTGSGKTVQAIELFNWAMSKYWAGCFYLNRRLLIPQTAEKFSAARLPYGIRAADYEDLYDFSAPFQICSADTERSRVYERKIWPLHDAQLIIVDEAHLQKTGAMAQILKDYRARGARVVLLTATPIGLSRWADELVISGKMQEYRDCKALVPAVVRSIEQPDLSKVKRNATGEYVLDGEKRRIYTQSIVGNVIERWKKYNPDARPTMVYWPGKPESVWGTEQFAKIGVSWCHVDATDAVLDGKRYTLTRSLWDEILQRYKAGEIKGLSSRFKLREGIDAPNTYHCILATPIGSLASYVQTIGRVLRYSLETPDSVLVTDHGGNYWRHGSPNHDRPWKDWWSLPEHVVSSLHQQSIKERKEPEPIRCPKCEGERKGGIKCPHCGFEHQKSQRHVIMEDGSMVVREGHLVRPKFTQCKPDTQREWTAMYKGFFNSPKAREKTFAQMEAFFYHKYKYCPPRTLNFMPIDPVDWHRKIRNVPLERLTGAKNV
jgi:DNA repair protein RadD